MNFTQGKWCSFQHFRFCPCLDAPWPITQESPPPQSKNETQYGQSDTRTYDWCEHCGEESWHTSDRVTQQWDIMHEIYKHNNVKNTETKHEIRTKTENKLVQKNKWTVGKKERRKKTKEKNNSDWKDTLETNELCGLTATGAASSSLVQAVLSRHHRKEWRLQQLKPFEVCSQPTWRMWEPYSEIALDRSYPFYSLLHYSLIRSHISVHLIRRSQRAVQNTRQCAHFQASLCCLQHSQYSVQWGMFLTGWQSHYVIIYIFIFRKCNAWRSFSASCSFSRTLFVLWTVLVRPKLVNIAPPNDPDRALGYKGPRPFLWKRLPAFRFPVIINQWTVSHIRTFVLKATAMSFRLSLSDEHPTETSWVTCHSVLWRFYSCPTPRAT